MSKQQKLMACRCEEGLVCIGGHWFPCRRCDGGKRLLSKEERYLVAVANHLSGRGERHGSGH